jgi:hypothetical protein
MKTTLAPSSRWGTSASVNANGPRWFVAKVVSQPAAFFMTRGFWTPALLSNPTIGRSSAMICAAAPRTLARSDMSHTTGTACPPSRSIAFFTSLSLPLFRPTSTSVPCLAILRAVSRPTPEVGPVTT